MEPKKINEYTGVDPKAYNWENMGRHLIKSVEFSVNNELVSKTYYCEKTKSLITEFPPLPSSHAIDPELEQLQKKLFEHK